MLGTLINVIGVLIGVSWAMLKRPPLDAAFQQAAKLLLAVSVTWTGLSIAWSGFGGSFKKVLGQLGMTLLAMSLGNLLGRMLGIQKGFNKLGSYARDRFDRLAASGPGPNRVGNAVTVATIVYCATPLCFLGALMEGLTGDPKPLILKAVMDALAAVSFASIFGWGFLLGAIPLLAVEGGITIAASAVSPFLYDHGLVDSVLRVTGMIIFCVTLVILEIKKVELGNYLPSLLFAPLIAWLFS